VEKYIDKMSTLEDKFDLFMEIESWRKAADAARVLRDVDRLKAVLGQCKDAALERQILDILSKL